MKMNRVEKIQNDYERIKGKVCQVRENVPYIEKMEEIRTQQVENNKKKLHIERLKEEIEAISDFQVKERYQVDIAKAEEDLQEGIENLRKLEQERDTIVNEKKKKERDVRKRIYDKINELQDTTRKEFIKQRKEIELKIQRNKIDYEMLNLKFSKFQYQYDENGKPTNGEEFRGMLERQQYLMERRKHLEEMCSMCDKYCDELVTPYEMLPELPNNKIYIEYNQVIEKTEQEEQEQKDDLLEKMVKGREKREQERYDETIEEAMEEEKRKSEQQKQEEQEDDLLEEMVKGREKREQERYDETIEEAMREEKRKFEQQKQEEQEQEQQVNIVLEIFENKIFINGKDNNLFYKEEVKNKKELMEEYAINSRFYGDKKNIKNIDWALLSTLDEIDDKDNTLVMNYLSIIRGSGLKDKSLEESIKEFNERVHVEYKFNVNQGNLLNLKEKRLARKAKELGIASLSGISEKSLWDRMKNTIVDKIRNRKFFPKNEKVQQLDSKGVKTRQEEQKKRTQHATNREDYKKEKMEKYKYDNRDGHLEANAMEAQQKVEVLKPDAVIGKDDEEIKL